MAGGGNLNSTLPVNLGVYVAEEEGNEKFRTVNQSIGFVSAGKNQSVFESLSNSFSFTNEVELATLFRLASDRLFFFGANAPTGQAVSHNYFYEDAINTFNFESLSGFNQEFDIIQYLGFSDRFFAPPIAQTVFGPLNAGNKVAESIVVDATNTFSFFRHDAPFFEALKQTYNISNTLTGTQGLYRHEIQDVDDLFSFESIVSSAASTYDRPATHGVIRQHLTYHVTGGDCPAEKIYRPFVGDSPETEYPAVSEIPPTLGSATLTFELNIPLAPTQTLTLQNPVFGNQDDLRFTRVDRKTRGGQRKLYSDQDWGTVQRLSFRVEKLCSQTTDNVIAFLNAANGFAVTLIDWENRQWTGVIVSADTEVFTDENDTTTFDIVFEGELL